MNAQFLLCGDGSFHVQHHGKTLLRDCFPGIDHRPLRVSSMKQEGSSLLYETPDGTVLLELQEEKEGFSIHASFQNYTRAIHSFSVLGEAAVPHLEGFFQSAGEIGAPCGYIETSKKTEPEKIQGTGMAGLRYDGGALLLWCQDHTHYENQYTLQCRPGEETLFSAEFRLEYRNAPCLRLPALYCRWYDSLTEGLEETALSIGKAMNARVHQPPAFHWCSWYYYYSEFDQKQLSENLAAFQKEDPAHQLRYIQIDAAYSSAVGDWLSPRSYWPKGIEGAVKDILQAGYTPGIWIGPFMVGNRSLLAAQHPDWLLKNADGSLLRQWIFDNEPKLWGYQDEEYYVLDTSHPDAMEYLRTVFRTFRNMGIRFFKTDFMLWGLKDSSTVQRHTPGKTSVEYFRDVLEMIRREIGEESYWLGCIAPFYPFIGYADAMRVGGDVGSSWDGQFNPHSMIQSVNGNLHTNYAFYQTDPDAIFFRDFHIRLQPYEIRSLALYAALSGGCVYTSDPIQKLPPDRKELLWFLQPDRPRKARNPYLARPWGEQVLLQSSQTGSRHLLLIFNTENQEHFQEYRLEDLGIQGPVYLWNFDGSLQNQFCTHGFTLRTEGHHCHLLLLSQEPVKQLHMDSLWKNLEDKPSAAKGTDGI